MLKAKAKAVPLRHYAYVSKVVLPTKILNAFLVSPITLCSAEYIITVGTVRWLARLTATYQRQYSCWHLYIYSKSLARLNSVTDLVDFVLREAVHTSETSVYFSEAIWCYRRLFVIFIPACLKHNSVPCATKHTTRSAKTKSRYF
jgi:hypothetical protein